MARDISVPKAKGGLRKLASCVGQYKAASIWTSVLVALEVLFEVFIPIIMAQIVDVGMAEVKRNLFSVCASET